VHIFRGIGLSSPGGFPLDACPPALRLSAGCLAAGPASVERSALKQHAPILAKVNSDSDDAMPAPGLRPPQGWSKEARGALPKFFSVLRK
jgi:hypothetical protein